MNDIERPNKQEREIQREIDEATRNASKPAGVNRKTPTNTHTRTVREHQQANRHNAAVKRQQRGG